MSKSDDRELIHRYAQALAEAEIKNDQMLAKWREANQKAYKLNQLLADQSAELDIHKRLLGSLVKVDNGLLLTLKTINADSDIQKLVARRR